MSPLRTAPAPQAARDAELRAAYLAEVLTTLYPGGAGDHQLLILPHPRTPKLLLPAGAPRLAAAAVRYCTEPRSRKARMMRGATATALRCGSEVFLRDRVRVELAGSLQEHLEQQLDEPAQFGVHIGPARANRKPVVQLIGPAGNTRGFAKLGIGPLTRRLVQAETGALATLDRCRLRQVTVPEIRYAGNWRGHVLMVQTPVPVWRRRSRLDPHRLMLAMREVAHCAGVSHAPLAASPYWDALVARVNAVATSADSGGRAGAIGSGAGVLAAAIATLRRRVGHRGLRYGAWHGDWSPWNMAVLPETLLVWDWERFTVGVPVGFDALHFDLQTRLTSSPDAAGALRGTLGNADALLAPFDVAPAMRTVTGLLYLVDLATRYLADRQAHAGARLGVLGTWLLPVLTHYLEELR